MYFAFNFPVTARITAMICGSLFFNSESQASLPGDEHWDNQFGAPGANGQVFALTVCGNQVYVGGTFVSAGNTKAATLAGFDGTNWFQLGSGLFNSGSPEVVGLGTDGTNVFVGGIFTNADNSGVTDNAIWNGSRFSPMYGGGFNGVGEVFKTNGTNFYVGGSITTAGSVTLNGIGRWDGSSWQPLGTGVSGCTGQFCLASVTALAFQGSDVYAGGNFVTVGGVSASYIARYDGTAWHAVGSGINGPVSALVFCGGYLYAGGSFTNTGGLMNIARWDGTSWSGLPGGGASRQVSDLATDGTNVYVGGQFNQIGGIAATGVVSFSGSTWTPLSSGLHLSQNGIGQVYKMAWQSNQLYVAGNFEAAGNVAVANVARWDGANWWSLGGNTSQGISSVVVDRVFSLLPVQNSILLPSGLYVGGFFDGAGDVIVNGLGRWDGASWNSVGGGVTGPLATSVSVRALATDGAYLYAAGYFTNAGNSAASNIAYWDGSNWNPMGSGVDYIANALVVGEANYIYVGGDFTNAGGIYSRGLAVSAYGSWYNLGNVEGTNGQVYSLAFDGVSKVYAGGSFFSGGGVPATNVAYFDENDFSWHALGNGLNAKPNSVAYGNGLLYAGGSFTQAGTVNANHVAKWDGTNWSAMGSGITGSSSVIVNSILVAGTNVYVTGNFTNAGGISATNIARWDGFTWHAMGSGLDISKAGFAQATNGNDLYVGGNFLLAGDKAAIYLARWNDQTNFYPAPHPLLTRQLWLTNRQFQFRLAGTSGESYILQGSTNLGSWTPLLTNTVPLYDFTDPNASKFPTRYYRAVLEP